MNGAYAPPLTAPPVFADRYNQEVTASSAAASLNYKRVTVNYSIALCGRKGESSMPCTEAYREHIMYTFNGFCKTVIRFAAINAWRDRSRRRQKEISLEYLTEEKFYPLGTTDEYFEAPYEEHPITICGQTVILTNGELAAALLSLPERNREIIFLYFFGDYTQQEIGKMYGRCRSTTGYQIRRTLRLLQRKMEVLSHGESEPFAL